MRTTLLVLLAIVAMVAAYKSFHGHMVFKISIETDEQLEALERLEGQGLVDVWSERSTRGALHDVRVEPSNLHIFTTTMFEKLNTKYEIMIDNVQKLVDAELAHTAKVGPFNGANDDFFANYRNGEEFNSFLDQLHAAYPQQTTLFSIGKTLLGRDIRGIKITGASSNGTKGAMVFNGGQHAREWVSPMTVAYFANRLLKDYQSDAATKRLVDNLEWHLIPVINGDGYNYTWTGHRLWRKNMRKNQGSSCMGVDPNRNWDYKWDATGGSSTNPCSETYRGPKPFSEPESTAIGNYTRNLPNIKGYIDFHSYSQLFMRPWGYTSAAPADEPKMKEANEACVNALKAVHGKSYEAGRISITIYEASGSSVDFVYGVTKAISFAVELRPDQYSSSGFLLPADQIVPTAEENYAAAVLTFGDYVLTH